VASFAPGYHSATTIELAKKQLAEHEKLNLPGFSGSIANELGNVRFDGEGDAALQALQAFADYLACDQRMRAAAASTNPGSASVPPAAKPASANTTSTAVLPASKSASAKPASAAVAPASKSFELATRIGLGYDPNSSNYFFSKYEDALGRTLNINQEHLNFAVEKAIAELNGLVTGSLLLSLLIIICTYLGLLPRIEEYQTKAYLHRRH
jgi:hypothetical protein